MPATLSIITNTFPPEERGRAIGVWAAIAGVATALGPISGGFLIEHFYWGSIFLVNVPIVSFALIAGVFLIPTSKDPSKPALDPIGALLSIVGLVTLVYALHPGARTRAGPSPDDPAGCSRSRSIVLAAFALWESYNPSPMLDTSFFQNPRFTRRERGHHAALLRDVRLDLPAHAVPAVRHGLHRARSRRPPAADGVHDARRRPERARASSSASAPSSSSAAGLTIAGIGLALLATVPAENISYWGDVAWRMVIMAIGMGLTMAPATESIMGSLPRAKAGIGSAMNDTTRQVGGAFGVAIIGSVMSSVYGSRVADAFSSAGRHRQPAVDQPRNGLGQALAVAGDPERARPASASSSQSRRRTRSCTACTAACSSARLPRSLGARRRVPVAAGARATRAPSCQNHSPRPRSRSSGARAPEPASE